jgi:hypothetical protein
MNECVLDILDQNSGKSGGNLNNVTQLWIP